MPYRLPYRRPDSPPGCRPQGTGDGLRIRKPEGAHELICRAATALGVATEPDLRDYYRLQPERSQQAVTELVEAGELEPLTVCGWRVPAYRHRDARTPRRITGAVLLCPFDPLIWDRTRTERLFGFRYRIEIYVPESQRHFGYYVFPFLMDGELVARVDLKADRSAGVLRVPGAFAEPGVDIARVIGELSAALREMAEWLELDRIAVGERGDLAAALARALGRPGPVLPEPVPAEPVAPGPVLPEPVETSGEPP